MAGDIQLYALSLGTARRIYVAGHKYRASQVYKFDLAGQYTGGIDVWDGVPSCV